MGACMISEEMRNCIVTGIKSCLSCGHAVYLIWMLLTFSISSIDWNYQKSIDEYDNIFFCLSSEKWEVGFSNLNLETFRNLPKLYFGLVISIILFFCTFWNISQLQAEIEHRKNSWISDLKRVTSQICFEQNYHITFCFVRNFSSKTRRPLKSNSF